MRCHITADTTTNSTGHITFKYVETHAQDLCVNVSNIIDCGTVFIFFGGGLEGSHAEHRQPRRRRQDFQQNLSIAIQV